MPEKLLYKPSEVALVIDSSKTTVYDLIKRGEIPSIRVGNDLRVPVAGLHQWIAKQLKGRK